VTQDGPLPHAALYSIVVIRGLGPKPYTAVAGSSGDQPPVPLARGPIVGEKSTLVDSDRPVTACSEEASTCALQLRGVRFDDYRRPVLGEESLRRAKHSELAAIDVDLDEGEYEPELRVGILVDEFRSMIRA